MAIGDATGSISHQNRDISQEVNTASTEIESIVGSTEMGRSIYGGYEGYRGYGGQSTGANESFAGMDSDNLAQFTSAVDRYEAKTAEIINLFNPTPEMEQALKGDVATAVHDFLTSVKKLLVRYVETIEIEKKEIEEANANWLAAAGEISGDISADSSDISTRADALKID